MQFDAIPVARGPCSCVPLPLCVVLNSASDPPGAYKVTVHSRYAIDSNVRSRDREVVRSEDGQEGLRSLTKCNDSRSSAAHHKKAQTHGSCHSQELNSAVRASNMPVMSRSRCSQ